LGSSLIVAVRKVNLEIEDATFVVIVGPSGSGKTTLLNLIGLIDHPTSGKVFFQGKDTSLLTRKELRKIRLQSIGFVFQNFNLIPTLTALENVELPMALAGVPIETQRKTAIQLLETVGLSSRMEHRPKELSYGEMQRVAIARALANDPSLIIADEPTGELDSETGLKIVELLSALCRELKKTIIVATHDEQITKAADITYQIRDGSITPKA
jgi:ABC-type lipoprotein export system ATPase subunit